MTEDKFGDVQRVIFHQRCEVHAEVKHQVGIDYTAFMVRGVGAAAADGCYIVSFSALNLGIEDPDDLLVDVVQALD